MSIGLVAVVAWSGAAWTDTRPGSWYDGLEQPSWNPPDWLFAPVWTTLYLLMAVAAWLVVRADAPAPAKRRALALYGVQLVLNLGWTGLFFALERPGWALVEIAGLLVAVIATIVAFRPVSSVAAGMLVPYALWVSYASALTAAIVVLN
ncbi:MAG: TspO/MBR family protein [Acidimicrobiales bacterium]